MAAGRQAAGGGKRVGYEGVGEEAGELAVAEGHVLAPGVDGVDDLRQGGTTRPCRRDSGGIRLEDARRLSQGWRKGPSSESLKRDARANNGETGRRTAGASGFERGGGGEGGFIV